MGHPMIKNRASVFFYQFGYIEKPWDQVSHGYDIIALFGEDIDWVNGGVAFSEKFEITQEFFGDYIKGKFDESMSVQNGYYVQIVDEVKKVAMSDLDVVRERCEVYKLFGDDIWRSHFCAGLYPQDWSPEAMEKMMAAMAANGTETVADKQEI